MLELGEKVIITTSEDEAILAVVVLIYSNTLVRLAPLNKKGEPQHKKAFAVLVEHTTPVL